MFTGLIQMVGTIQTMERGPGGARLVLNAPLGDVTPGESVALNGCCLTALEADRDRFSADLSPETIDCTTFSALGVGSRVNVERALTVGEALGGHLVQGHVDNIGQVASVENVGENRVVRFTAPQVFTDLCVPKGSVTVDGVSLTVNELHDGYFEVNLVPHTLLHTTFGDLRVADPVNLEADVIGKYVVRTLLRLKTAEGGIDEQLSALAGITEMNS